jgi:hypothetical protein
VGAKIRRGAHASPTIHSPVLDTDVPLSQGLSVFLFIFAFLGNLFYVASILASPNLQKPAPEAAAFLKESIP